MVASFVFLGMFFVLLPAGQRGGRTFFSNPWLAWPILLAVGAAIAGGTLATAAIFWNGERSLFVFGTLLWGLCVLVFATGELGLVGPPPAPECSVRIDWASVRSGPGDDYPALAVLPDGASLVPSKRGPGGPGQYNFWLLVTYDTDQHGWIHIQSVGCNFIPTDLPVEDSFPPPRGVPSP